MSSATQLAPKGRSLPVIATFELEPDLRTLLKANQRYRHAIFERALNLGEKDGSPGETILLTSRPDLLNRYCSDLRNPDLRVILLSSSLVEDLRLESIIYAYLPLNTPLAMITRMIDNAVDHIHVNAQRRKTLDRFHQMSREIRELNHIGTALSAEHDTDKLLELILSKARDITASDAGSLYLLEKADQSAHILASPQNDGPRRMRFMLAQNDSVHITFREALVDVDERSIAGYVALRGVPVNIPDAYALTAEVPYAANRKFDEDSGYTTRSILAVPMKNAKGEVVGVLQLINAKLDRQARLDSRAAVDQQVIAFTLPQEEMVLSMASQAAVALENSRLYEAIQQLFEGFVKASVVAIESRDPTTSGHSFRVANLTVALAKAVDRGDSGRYAGTQFTRTQLREIKYASLLHDFGKVGVREEVLVKAKKLYPVQLELVRQRFQLVKRTIEQESSSARLDYLLEKGREEYLACAEAFDAERGRRLAELDNYFEFILRSNEPTIFPEGKFEQLLQIASEKFRDTNGRDFPLLTDTEVRLLSIRKGSLDEAERKQIESHVVHTYKFLQQIPWTPEIRNIPMIARSHHERLNGRGYPYGLAADEIPVQTRMMSVADIFDALAASDRPYKRAVSLDISLSILEDCVRQGEIDEALFAIFRDAKIYDYWTIEQEI